MKARCVPFYCNCPPGLQDWFIFRGLGLHKELSLIKLTFSFFFQYSPLLLELKITFVIETWPEGSFHPSHQTGCLTRAYELKRIYQKNVSVNDIDVRDAVMIPVTLILSGTPNPQATSNIVSTQKVVISALCSWLFKGAMKIDPQVLFEWSCENWCSSVKPSIKSSTCLQIQI